MGKDSTESILCIEKVKKASLKAFEGVSWVRYKHLYTVKNPGWSASLRCLFINANLHAKLPIKAVKSSGEGLSHLVVSTSPKWYSWYQKSTVCTETGELITEVVESDSDKKKRGLKVGKLRSFDSTYLPLYQARKVSLLFVTLTAANGANQTISGLLKALKQRALRNGSEVLGYVWVGEVSMRYGTPHWHYHLLVAIPRLQVRVIPSWLKLECMWGKRTQVQFVRRSGASVYLSKYLSKESGSMCSLRSIGSGKFKVL